MEGVAGSIGSQGFIEAPLSNSGPSAVGDSGGKAFDRDGQGDALDFRRGDVVRGVRALARRFAPWPRLVRRGGGSLPCHTYEPRFRQCRPLGRGDRLLSATIFGIDLSNREAGLRLKARPKPRSNF